MIEKLGRTSYYYEFRINKKGCECFRTDDKEEAMSKLAELSAKRPGVYTMQHRSVRLNRYGIQERPINQIGWT